MIIIESVNIMLFLWQGMLVFFIAIMAFLLIARENPISLGRYDWRLLLATCLIPVASGVIFFSLGFMGPARGWYVSFSLDYPNLYRYL